MVLAPEVDVSFEGVLIAVGNGDQNRAVSRAELAQNEDGLCGSIEVLEHLRTNDRVELVGGEIEVVQVTENSACSRNERPQANEARLRMVEPRDILDIRAARDDRRK